MGFLFKGSEIGLWGSTYRYDANGITTEQIWYNWDLLTDEWVTCTRVVNEYDAQGNHMKQNWYTWDLETSECFWENHYIYKYDENGNHIQKSHDYWDYDDVDSQRFDTTLFAYDDNGNLNEQLLKIWDSGRNDMVRYDRYVYTHDANGNRTQAIYYDWDTISIDWVYSLKGVYYWSELTTSISNNTIDHNYIVYPNPFTDYTTIQLSDANQVLRIDLIDIHGRIIRTISNVKNNSVTIHRENLPSGTYFIRIQSDNAQMIKVIIR